MELVGTRNSGQIVIGRQLPWSAAPKVTGILAFDGRTKWQYHDAMMAKLDFVEHLSTLKLSFPEAAQLLGVSERTARRWAEGELVPGPVEAALRAWRRLDAQCLPWKPD